LHATAENAVREIVSEHIHSQSESNRRQERANQVFTIIGASVLLFNFLLLGAGVYRAFTIAHVELSEPVLMASTDVCPGGTLDYSFVMGVSRDALVELKTSIRKVDPNARISYARLQEFSFEDATTLEFIRHYVIPPTYTDPVTGGEVPWEPGPYEQITIANVTGRSATSTITVPFTIRSSCP
jgi:hypothetical protein